LRPVARAGLREQQALAQAAARVDRVEHQALAEMFWQPCSMPTVAVVAAEDRLTQLMVVAAAGALLDPVELGQQQQQEPQALTAEVLGQPMALQLQTQTLEAAAGLVGRPAGRVEWVAFQSLVRQAAAAAAEKLVCHLTQPDRRVDNSKPQSWMVRQIQAARSLAGVEI